MYVGLQPLKYPCGRRLDAGADTVDRDIRRVLQVGVRLVVASEERQAKASANHQAGLRTVGEAETRRQIAVIRIDAGSTADAVDTRLDDADAGWVKVGDVIVLFRIRREDVVPKAKIKRQF